MAVRLEGGASVKNCPHCLEDRHRSVPEDYPVTSCIANLQSMLRAARRETWLAWMREYVGHCAYRLVCAARDANHIITRAAYVANRDFEEALAALRAAEATP